MPGTESLIALLDSPWEAGARSKDGPKRLYERHGFREVARRPVVPHQVIRYTGDALLMVAEVA